MKWWNSAHNNHFHDTCVWPKWFHFYPDHPIISSDYWSVTSESGWHWTFILPLRPLFFWLWAHFWRITLLEKSCSSTGGRISLWWHRSLANFCEKCCQWSCWSTFPVFDAAFLYIIQYPAWIYWFPGCDSIAVLHCMLLFYYFIARGCMEYGCPSLGHPPLVWISRTISISLIVVTIIINTYIMSQTMEEKTETGRVWKSK